MFMKLSRPAILLGIPSLIGSILVIGALLLPLLIDSRWVREQISSEFVSKTDASLNFSKIALLWFPWPNVVIENAVVSFADHGQGTIRTAKIYPSIFHLLAGRVVVRRALLQEPKITIRLRENREEPYDAAELEKQIQSALVSFTKDIRAVRVELSNGVFEISMGEQAAVVLDDVAAQISASTNAVRFELGARSNLAERLQIDGTVSPENLASQIEIVLKGFKVKESMAFLSPPILADTRQGEASLKMKINAIGLRKLKVAIDGSVGPLVFARNGAGATLEAKKISGGITYDAGLFQLDVEQIDLVTPRLRASGQVKLLSGLLSASVKARDIDIAEVGAFALRIVDEPEDIKRILRYVQAGTIREFKFDSAGRSLREMAFNIKTVASGLLRDGKIFLPEPDLELQHVGGSVQISGGVLSAEKVSATLGTAKGVDGKLRLGLQGEAPAFHLDIALRTGAAELHSVLLKFARDQAWRKELLKMRKLEGELSGRLILGETLGAVVPRVAISAANISGSYQPVPFPIAIRGGQFNYDGDTVRLENARGSIGRSTFAGVGLLLQQDKSRKMNLAARQISLDLQQTERLIRSFEYLPDFSAKLRSVRGEVESR